MAGFLDVITPVTIANYALGAWDSISQNHPLWAMLKKQGSFEYDVGGTTVVGPIEAGRNLPFISAPGQDLTPYLKSNVRYAQYSFTWAELSNALTIDAGALRRNSGPQALVKLKEKEVPAMIRDTAIGLYGLHWQFLNQNITVPTGTGASTGLPIGGLPSCLLQPAATGLIGSDGVFAGGSAPTYSSLTAGDVEAAPGTSSQTYGGLSMAPIGSNGAGTGGLTGVDNAEFDAWTPTLVNTSSTGWASGTAAVATNCLQWAQWAVSKASRFSNTDVSKKPKFGFMSFDYFNMLGTALAGKTQIYAEGNRMAEDQNANVGYNTAKLPHAGIWWYWDEFMPSKSAYVLNPDYIFVKVQPLYKSLDSNSPSPLTVSGEDAGILETAITWDPVRRQWIITCTFPGQVMIHPRYQVRCGEYA